MTQPAAGFDPEEPPNLVVAGRYRNQRAGRERAVVVLAMRLPCWLVAEESGSTLLVRPEDAAEVAEQLRRYERERPYWPPPPAPPEPPPSSARWRAARSWALVWVLAEIAAFWFQNRSAGRWEEHGDLRAEPIFHHGQLWRPWTALFLHGDLMHLAGNLAAGYFAIAAVLASGASLATAGLSLAGAAYAANLAAAALQGPNDASLGASTAVFAALGLLTGRAVRAAWPWRSPRSPGGPAPASPWRVAIPLGSGAALLALYGTGTPGTDVVAHLTGFAAGLLGGICVAGSCRPRGHAHQ